MFIIFGDWVVDGCTFEDRACQRPPTEWRSIFVAHFGGFSLLMRYLDWVLWCMQYILWMMDAFYFVCVVFFAWNYCSKQITATILLKHIKIEIATFILGQQMPNHYRNNSRLNRELIHCQMIKMFQFESLWKCACLEWNIWPRRDLCLDKILRVTLM